MWIEKNGKLSRNLVFKDFKQAFAFMTEMSIIVNELDHHPWWSNVYNKVNIELTTHDEGNTVTNKDKELAEKMDAALEKYELS